LPHLWRKVCLSLMWTSHLLDSHNPSVPGKRYALTLQVMLRKRDRKRKATSMSSAPIPLPARPPKVIRDSHRPLSMALDPPGMVAPPHARIMETFSPTYDPGFASAEAAMQAPPMVFPTDAEHIWRGFEMTSNSQLPVWLSDESLGGNSFSQNGMDAFLLPTDYLPPPPRLW
jgi:hypothetical protein